VFLPTTYCAGGDGVDDAVRLGRRTDWMSVGDDGTSRGIGLRTYLVGEDARHVLEIGRMTFEG
jgi:protein involved in temperature-dependent protein secretion